MDPQPEQWSQLIDAVLRWMPPAFTLIGWFVVNRQSNNRERRKEDRAAADRCKVLVRDASQAAIQYWSGQGSVKDWQLVALLEELEVDIGRLPQPHQEALLKASVALTNAALGYNFGVDGFKPGTSDHPVFKEITRSRQKLLVAIEAAVIPTQGWCSKPRSSPNGVIED